MVKKERWGKKQEDKRDWKAYNEELVVRGEFLLDLDWVKNWNKELEDMNSGKKGAPYQFPESLIEFQAVLHQWIDYRGLEGVARRLVKYSNLPRANDYSTINRRVNEIDTTFELPKTGSIMTSTDGSGMKMSNRGEYKEAKYGKGQKKFLKVTITADPKKKKLLNINVEIDGEGHSEPEITKSHLEELIEQGFDISKFFGDGAFDVHDLFDFLDMHGIDPAIKIRKNATTDDPNGSWRRAQEVLKYKKWGYKKWAKKKKYGIRWLGTEGIFSAIKRKFGENIRARKTENMLHEVKRKFWAYDKMQLYART